MTKIKRLAPKKCPDCGSQGTLFVDLDRTVTCRLCGYKHNENSENEATNSDADPRSRWQIKYSTPHTDDVDRWAETKYFTGLDYVERGDYDNAIIAFEQAVDQQWDFIDAHLWIARLAQDPEEKRYHYGEVIAHIPTHLESTRELMVLNGEMTRTEADRALDMSREQDVREADHAVGTHLTEIVCSNCGGTLEVPAGTETITCQFCGSHETVAQDQGVGFESLIMAMIKDRGKGTRWRVGKHLLHCDNCGAERVITSKSMTQQCPFCGSNHVIKADALKSFRQPDGIVPFEIERETAAAAIEKALNSFSEKLKGFFVNNRPDRITLTQVFLPFWLFDVTAKISRTRIDNTSKRTLAQARGSNTREEYGDALNNIPYCGVTSPPHRLTDRLEQYDLSEVQPYDPKLLAGTSAELYSIDYQQASIRVRREIAERFRFRHGHDQHGDIQVHVSHLIQSMTFRLVMLPVWIATIIEDDGDVRLGLIHGQTGRALLGKAARPEK